MVKRFLLVFICGILFCGCGGKNTAVDQAMSLRSAILQAKQCTFSLDITADYGDMTYDFSMDCLCDDQGTITFTVTAPQTISGITGSISNSGGNLTFDDTVLAIPMLTDDQLTPVSAPWILMRTLRAGCITSGTDGRVTIDDSYADDALKLDIYLGEDQMPKEVDIYWKNRRILALTVKSFIIS